VTVYGQARPAPNGEPTTVDVQNAPSGDSFSTVASVPVTSANNTFTVKLPDTGGKWRLRWNGISSREAEASKR
jgi:hypothetical protein